MANNKNNAGANLYYYGKNPSPATDQEHNKKILATATAVFTVVVLLIWLLCFWVHKKDSDEEVAAGVGNRARQSSEAARAPPPTVAGAAMEVVSSPVRAAEPPLLCTFIKTDGWQDSSCGVCLAELTDGDVLRVLPVCMHCFHAACVGEWLRGHDTCPLCRAPLVALAVTA